MPRCQECGSPEVTKTFVCVRCGGAVDACLAHEQELGGTSPLCKRCEDTARHSKVPPK